MKPLNPHDFQGSSAARFFPRAVIQPRPTVLVADKIAFAKPGTGYAETAGAVMAGLALSETFFHLRGPQIRRNVLHVKFRV